MKYVIIDASVAIKWILDEPPLSERARAIQDALRNDRLKGVVPELFYYEIASGCAKKVKQGILRMKRAVDLHETILQLPFKTYSDRELSDVALDNAYQYDISIYDAAYLALAEIHNAPLITADQRLVKACQGKFEWIEYLGDFEG